VRLVVLIPAFNHRPDLDRTLASLAHDPQPFDILVVDDGSEPPLEIPATAGLHQVLDAPPYVNGGIARALNAGVAWILTQGYAVVARLDAGDLNMPARLARQTAFLAAHPDVALVGGWTRHVDEQLRPLYALSGGLGSDTEAAALPDRLQPRRLHGAGVGAATAGAYREDCPLGEDYELFWRLALRFRARTFPTSW
jgi:glycosyltransferase involved in cell wall biosynthesis